MPLVKNKSSLLVVCLNPVLQKTIQLRSLETGEVNRVIAQRIDASGKGVNLSRVYSQLGGSSAVLTHLNAKRHREFLKLCTRDHVKLITIKTNTPLRHGYTLIDTERNLTTEVIEEGAAVESRCVKRIMDTFRNVLPRFQALAITGSKAAAYPDSLYPDMVRLAKQKGLRIYCDLRGKDLLGCIEAGTDIIKLNLDEFRQSFAGSTKRNFDIDAALKKAREISSQGTETVITLGSEGAGGYGQGKIQRQKGIEITPRNTIGCGDAYLAGFIFSYETHRDFAAAMKSGEDCAIKNALSIRPGSIAEDNDT